jgi:hypothetical protein
VPPAKYWHAVAIDPKTGDIVSRYIVRRH